MLVVAEGRSVKQGGKLLGPGQELVVGDSLPKAQVAELVALGYAREVTPAAPQSAPPPAPPPAGKPPAKG